MHDWTLVSISIEWAPGRGEIVLKDSSSKFQSIQFEGLVKIFIPKLEEWGPSVSINSVESFVLANDRMQGLKIEMQSGDIIEIETAEIRLPD